LGRGLRPRALALLAGEVGLGILGEVAEGERGLEPVDGLHRFGLTAGEEGGESLAGLTAGEDVAEDGEGGGGGFHCVDECRGLGVAVNTIEQKKEGVVKIL
jgi:hypothetical protein